MINLNDILMFRMPRAASVIRNYAFQVLMALFILGGAFYPTLSAQQVTYQLDDGTAELATGPNAGESGAFLNRFQVQGEYSQITSIEVQWASFSSANQVVVAAVWSDPNQNSQPEDSVILGTSLPTLSNYAGGWQSFDLQSSVDVGEAGDYFFVGLYYRDPGFTLLLNVDNSGSNQSFIKQINSPYDPNDLSGYSQSTNLMIRATAVPEPSSLFVLALGGLLLAPRRRR